MSVFVHSDFEGVEFRSSWSRSLGSRVSCVFAQPISVLSSIAAQRSEAECVGGSLLDKMSLDPFYIKRGQNASNPPQIGLFGIAWALSLPKMKLDAPITIATVITMNYYYHYCFY